MFMFFSFKELKNISLWLRQVFIAACSLSLVAASRGYSLLWSVGFSFQWLLLSQSTVFSSCGMWAQQLWCMGLVAPGACGIFPEQGSNPRFPHWQADFQPLDHQRGLNVSIREIKLLSFVDSENNTMNKQHSGAHQGKNSRSKVAVGSVMVSFPSPRDLIYSECWDFSLCW